MQRAVGVFDHMERRPGESVADLYEGRLALLETAELLGFTGYHLAEHHQTPLSMAPSPNVFLAAAAQRTSRIRLGSLVHLLPFYHPIRLVEELCMVDHLSGGRLDVGLGKGVSPYEQAYFDVDLVKADRQFHELVGALVTGLTSDRLTFEGRDVDLVDVPMELRPLQQPHPPFWYGVRSPRSLQFAASRGINAVAGGPISAVGTVVSRYRELRAEGSDAAVDLSGGREPRLGALRHVLVAETDAEAEALGARAHHAFYRNIAKLWRDFGSSPVVYVDDFDATRKAEVLLVGSPVTVADQVEAFFEGSGADYGCFAFAWGDLTQEQALRSLTLFGEEILPSVQG